MKQSCIRQRTAKIFTPKVDETVEVQSKYMARIDFVAEISHFDTQRERKNLGIRVDYANNTSEHMQLLEDDFILLEDHKHVVNTSIFLQKIDWTTPSKAAVSLVYLNPIEFITVPNLHRELAAILHTSAAAGAGGGGGPSEHLKTSITLTKAPNIFTLVIKSRVL